jgi:hypothetical protein
MINQMGRGYDLDSAYRGEEMSGLITHKYDHMATQTPTSAQGRGLQPPVRDGALRNLRRLLAILNHGQSFFHLHMSPFETILLSFTDIFNERGLLLLFSDGVSMAWSETRTCNQWMRAGPAD